MCWDNRQMRRSHNLLSLQCSTKYWRLSLWRHSLPYQGWIIIYAYWRIMIVNIKIFKKCIRIIYGFLYFADCCKELTITSTGLTKDYHPLVLGLYRQHGYSNGRSFYKNNNGLYLHFSTRERWVVSTATWLLLSNFFASLHMEMSQ